MKEGDLYVGACTGEIRVYNKNGGCITNNNEVVQKYNALRRQLEGKNSRITELQEEINLDAAMADQRMDSQIDVCNFLKQQMVEIAIENKRLLELLREAEIELLHTGIFISTRQKMNSTGLHLHENLLSKLSKVLSTQNQQSAENHQPTVGQILREALDRSPFDCSPCMHCGEPVICLPDGLPCCEKCAAEENPCAEK